MTLDESLRKLHADTATALGGGRSATALRWLARRLQRPVDTLRAAAAWLDGPEPVHSVECGTRYRGCSPECAFDRAFGAPPRGDDDDPPAYPDEVPCPHPSEVCTSCGAGPGQPCQDPSFQKENQR